MNAIPALDEVVFRFGPFELSPARRRLLRHGRTVQMGSRALDLLTILVEQAGKVVTKKELLSQVWPNVIVEDSNLRVHISALRRLLGDDRQESRYIVFVARRGYVFVAPLEFTQRAPGECESRAKVPHRWRLPLAEDYLAIS